MPEVNFDSIVGPTHNYAGLSPGNVASTRHRGETARPREAALQGLAKMAALHDLGVAQGVLPPQERPSVALHHRLEQRRLGHRRRQVDALAQLTRQAAQDLQLLLALDALGHDLEPQASTQGDDARGEARCSGGCAPAGAPG